MVKNQEVEAPKSPSAEALLANLAKFSEILNDISAKLGHMANESRQESKIPFQAYDFMHSLTVIGVSMLSDPEKAMANQQQLMQEMLRVSSHHLEKFTKTEENQESPEKIDADSISASPIFGFLHDAYEVFNHWSMGQIESVDGLTKHEQLKGKFYFRQLMEALNPRNFLFSNPELMRETIGRNGENLVAGITMFREDIIAGGGMLKVRQTDMDHFELGKNLAATPGQVVFQNDMMQLIQYKANTKKVAKKPILIVPPWINKFYILDLTQEKSMVKYLVDQGHTVFIISWINPGTRHRDKDWAAFMKEGPLAALDVMGSITSERKFNMVGYCVGGTLLNITLAYMAAKRDSRAASVTLFACQVDFEKAGELLVFIDEPQIQAMEDSMAEQGYLASSRMSLTFNMLRAGDLIWNYVVNNYLRGQKPRPFDLLYWNSDSTRMTAANHRFYLRALYKDNLLSQGLVEIDKVKINLSKISVPCYNVATKDDHIAPAESVYHGRTCFGGPMEFVLGGSGHIAGVINPPSRNRYFFHHSGDDQSDLQHWITTSKEIKGSWWPHWMKWLKSLDKTEIDARPVGSKKYPALEPAPGSYVAMK